MVLVILSIVATGVIPAIRNIQRDPLDVAAEAVTRLQSLARNAALESGGPVQLTLNPSTGEFLVDRMNDSIGEPMERGVLSLGPEVTVETSPVRMVFARTGFAPPDSLRLQSAGVTRLIRLGGWTPTPSTESDSGVGR